jgi:hypothetical protein
MPEQNKIDWSVFNYPRILFAEIAVPATGASTFLMTDQLKTGRDMLVDYIAVSEDTFSTGVGAANASYLQQLGVDWWIHDRAKFSPVGPIAPADALDNVYNVQRTTNFVAAQVAGRGVLQLSHPVRWMYNPMQNVSIDWLNPVSAAPTGTLITIAGMHGVGTITGHRRVFAVGATFATNVAGATQNIASATQTMGNPGDQPYLMEHFFINANGAQWTVLNDNRIVNHLRYRVRPTQGDAWSDLPVPLVFYGVQKGQPNRCVWFKPPGGPILLRKNNQMVFEFQVNAGLGFALNAQVAIIGRVAPGYTDIV